jgi:flagellar hook-associated protein 2
MSSSVSAVNTLLSGTTTTTPAINISSILAATSGASTPGIDVTAAVAAAIYADRAPERGWQADQTTLSSQTTALTAIQTATEAIATDMQSLNTLTGPLAARTATSSNSSDLTATAATGTAAGSHTVVVNNVATTGSWYSDLETSPTAPLPTSSLTLTTAGGGSVTIATGTGNAGDTLNDLATAINSATTSSGASLGVTATVVSDSTGSRLAIIANTSGTAADFSITSANYTGTTWTSPDMPAGSTLGANSITLTSGSATATPPTLATLTVSTTPTSGQTYAQLATAINTAVTTFNAAANAAIPPTPNLNVTATAGSDANGTNLTIASTSATPFTINEPTIGFTQANQATNASLTVDGVPIQSASNTVTGAIPGVTLTLLGASLGSPINLTVAADASQVSTAINQFVTDYNTALGLVNSQFSMSATTGSQGVLASDPTVRSLQDALEQAVSYVNTPATGTTTVSTLSDLGISVGDDGTLTVDSATLNGALTNNPTDVQNFFEGAALNGFANSMSTALNTFTSPADGAFTLDLSGISASNSTLTSEINDFETGYIASQQTSLTADYSAAEVALQQMPQEMAELNSELGFTNNGSSSG